MHIILCSTGINALGETFTLMMYAKDLSKNGHTCYFIAPKLGASYLLSSGIDADKVMLMPSINKEYNLQSVTDSNYKNFKTYVNKIKPNIIIVADWYHYKRNGMSNNNSYSLNWFDEKIPMLTFDHLGFAPNGKDLNANKFDISNLIVDLTVLDFYKVTERFSAIIRPCPHHNNQYKQKDNIFYWGMNNEINNNFISIKKDIYNSLNINNAKIIFQPVGLWQDRIINASCKNKKISFEYYLDLYIPILSDYFSTFNENIIYILLLSEEKKGKLIKNGNTTVVILPPLGHQKFMCYLISSDLFITDNLMSSNLGKSVFNLIPSLTIKNDLYINGKGELNTAYPLTDKNKKNIALLNEKGLLFPYKVFPLGLHEIEEMYEKNNFSHCFSSAELFNHNECIQTLSNLIFNNNYIQEQKLNQQKYIYQNQQLMSASKIIESCI